MAHGTKKLLTGGETLLLGGGYSIYGQAVTEGLVDPSEVSEEQFLEQIASSYELYGVTYDRIGRLWETDPHDIGVSRVVQAGLCGSGEVEKVEEAISDLRANPEAVRQIHRYEWLRNLEA